MGRTPSKTKAMTSNSEDSHRRRRLQSCITQLHPPPRFEQLSECSLFESTSFLPEISGCDMNTLKKEFESLNSGQKEAILKVNSNDRTVGLQWIRLILICFVLLLCRLSRPKILPSFRDCRALANLRLYHSLLVYLLLGESG